MEMFKVESSSTADVGRLRSLLSVECSVEYTDQVLCRSQPERIC